MTSSVSAATGLMDMYQVKVVTSWFSSAELLVEVLLAVELAPLVPPVLELLPPLHPVSRLTAMAVERASAPKRIVNFFIFGFLLNFWSMCLCVPK